MFSPTEILNEMQKRKLSLLYLYTTPVGENTCRGSSFILEFMVERTSTNYKLASNTPVAASHIFAVLSSEAVTIFFPSGLKEAAKT